MNKKETYYYNSDNILKLIKQNLIDHGIISSILFDTYQSFSMSFDEKGNYKIEIIRK